MRYEPFRICCEKIILMLTTDELKAVEELIPAKLYKKIYEHLLEIFEYDLIRIIYEEYRKAGRTDVKAFIKESETQEFVVGLFLQYPSLETKYSKKMEDYLKYIKEVYCNYVHDRNEISRTMQKTQGDLVDILAFQGDNHNGKSVAKIVTEKDVLYYKPVNSLNMQLFYEIVDFLLEGRKDIKIKKIKFYSTKEHMWMEEVKYECCTQKSQVEEYYYISGLYLMIFYILGSYDMHHENIISSGSTPAIIDFETLFNAQLSKIHENSNFKDSANTVINSAFIPFVNERGAFDVNLSGILCKTEKSRKHKQYVFVLTEDVFEIKEVESRFIIQNQVTLNGKEIVGDILLLEEIRKILREGFADASKIVLNNKIDFENIILRYLDKDNFECRQLLRPTQVYHKFIQALLHFNTLKSPTEEERILSILEKKFVPTDYGYLRVEEEVEKIKDGYIPKFYTYGDSRELYSGSRVVCEKYFAESIIDTLKQRVESFTHEQMKYQMHIIDLSILTLYGKEEFGNTHVLSEVTDDFLDKESVKKMVEPLIRRIISYIYLYDEKIGTAFLPHLSENDNMWVLKDMEVNLYENGGIILLLAAYGDTYNDLEILRYAASLVNFLNYRKEDESIKNLSVFSGRGCLLYLNYYLYRLFQRNDSMKQEAHKYKRVYLEMESKILRHVLDEKLCKEDFDFVNGVISTISFIFNVENIQNRNTDNSELKEKVVKKIIDSINENWIDDIGFAHGITGKLFCLSNIFNYSRNEKLLEIIKRGIVNENIIIKEKGIGNLKPTWCRGTTGIIYGRSLIASNMGQFLDMNTKNQLFFYDEKWIHAELNRGIECGNNMSLCHGIYGNLEIMLRMYSRKECNKKIRKYFNSFEELQWVSKSEIPMDLFMLGNTGVAYALLEIINTQLPSVLALEPFV